MATPFRVLGLTGFIEIRTPKSNPTQFLDKNQILIRAKNGLKEAQLVYVASSFVHSPGAAPMGREGWTDLTKGDWLRFKINWASKHGTAATAIQETFTAKALPPQYLLDSDETDLNDKDDDDDEKTLCVFFMTPPEGGPPIDVDIVVVTPPSTAIAGEGSQTNVEVVP